MIDRGLGYLEDAVITDINYPDHTCERYFTLQTNTCIMINDVCA